MRPWWWWHQPHLGFIAGAGAKFGHGLLASNCFILCRVCMKGECKTGHPPEGMLQLAHGHRLHKLVLCDVIGTGALTMVNVEFDAPDLREEFNSIIFQ